MQVQKVRQGYILVRDFFKRETEIPENWEYPKFAIAVKVNPITKSLSKRCLYIPMDAVDTQKPQINYFEERSSDENSSLPKFQENDILFARITPSTENGKTSLIENFQGVGIASSELTVLRPTEKVIPRYLYYYVKSERIRNFAVSQMMGTTNRQRVPDYVFKKDLNFELPPLKEQQKIASILSNVDSLISHTQKEIELTQKLKKGLMQKLLTKGIGHTKFKKVKLKYHFLELKIPENWTVKTIKEVSKLKKAVITGPFGLMLHSSDYVQEGTPLILIKNLKNGKINDSDIPKISEKDVQRLSRYQVQKGDIVFSRVGRVGSAALIENKHDGWLISGQMLRIRLQNPALNPYFVNYFIHSEFFIRYLIPELLGSTRDSINTTILENLPIILPPKKEQDDVVNFLEQIDSLIQKQQEYKSNLELLKKGLMQKLLTGKIRVRV